ncbi:HAD family hydrolase [Angustibacter luteus]|uniref:HAD family hydrolase n=1 Tax=Angustibacter luteus TaxID=658456 RepID=A0ABW1JDC7_9ACTN
MSAPTRPRWPVVALDVDGTILDHDGGLTDRVRSAVQAVADSGREVVLSTGRSLIATTPVLDRLSLTHGYAVTSNGAVTLRLDPSLDDGYELADVVTFDPRDALTLLREHLPQAVYAVEDLGTGFRLTAPFPDGELIGTMSIVPFEDLFERPATRVVVRSPEHTPEDFLELVERLGLHGGSYTVGWTAWLDIAPEGVSKAHGLAFAAQSLGVAAVDVLAVGDGRNDLEMFAWAGRSVAMGQAPAEVQDAADEVCADVYADGLADVLERLVAEGN